MLFHKSILVISLLTAFCASAALATTPNDPEGLVLGIAAGVYKANGTLVSDYLPDMEFRSVRRLYGDEINATTEAFLFGAKVATVSARLKVVPTDAQHFTLLDLNASSAPAGQGSCDESSCQFSVTVMDGALTLNETWIATADGFQIHDGRQTYQGADATYEATFHPISGAR